MEKLLTTDDLAERFRRSRGTIQDWCRQGRFPNAQKTGPRGSWLVPESSSSNLSIRPGPAQLRRRLTQPEYEALGLDVLAYWKKRAPRLRCQTCNHVWRSWDWKCPNGCNAGRQRPPDQIANPKLREARQQAGLTLSQLATAVGVSKSAVRHWELHGTEPKECRVREAVIANLGRDPWIASKD